MAAVYHRFRTEISATSQSPLPPITQSGRGLGTRPNLPEVFSSKARAQRTRGPLGYSSRIAAFARQSQSARGLPTEVQEGTLHKFFETVTSLLRMAELGSPSGIAHHPHWLALLLSYVVLLFGTGVEVGVVILLALAAQVTEGVLHQLTLSPVTAAILHVLHCALLIGAGIAMVGIMIDHSPGAVGRLLRRIVRWLRRHFD
jgi:hypothetical protein